MASTDDEGQSTSDQVSQSQGQTYTISNLPPSVSEIAVRTYRIVAYNPRPRDRQSFESWSIHLVHSDGCVQLRMVDVPKPNGQGQLQITSLPSSKPHSSARWWDFNPNSHAGKNVHQALGLITNRGRERYQFYQGGSGGRLWVKTCMYDFDEQQLIAELSSDYTTIKQIMPHMRNEELEGHFV